MAGACFMTPIDYPIHSLERQRATSIVRQSIQKHQEQRPLPVDTTFTKSLGGVSNLNTVQRWDGIERSATQWNSLRRDPELWFEDSECYIYLYAPGQSQRGPSFRLPYKMLDHADLNNFLDQYLISTWNASPYSTDSGPDDSQADCFLYLHAPKDLGREEAYQYHINTRNFFARLVGVPLVGRDPIAALAGLRDRMKEWCDDEVDVSRCLIEYIKMQGYCDMPEPMEGSFTSVKKTKGRGLPTPEGRRSGFKKMFGFKRVGGKGHHRRTSEVVGIEEDAATFKEVESQFRGGVAAKSSHPWEHIHPAFRTGRRESFNSMDESMPSLTHSRNVSGASDDSETLLSQQLSDSSSLSNYSPVSPGTPEIPSRGSSFDKTSPEWMQGEEIVRIVEDGNKQQEVIIDALIEELTEGKKTW